MGIGQNTYCDSLNIRLLIHKYCKNVRKWWEMALVTLLTFHNSVTLSEYHCYGCKMQAWPCSWDVDFKLAAPRNTVVSGRLVNGVLKDFEVTPRERRSSVIVLPCQNVTVV